MQRLCLALSIFMSTAYAGTDGNYGEDDRKDYFEITDPRIQLLAQSTATVIAKKELVELPNGNFKKRISQTLAEIGLCPDAKFASQKTFGHCSGSLIAKDQFLTAAHCFNLKGDMSYKDMYVVFDYMLKSSSQIDIEIIKENVFEIKELLYYDYSHTTMVDLSLVRLDKVVKRQPLKVNRSSKYIPGTPLFMIGHPIGLPSKYTDNATISKIDPSRLSFHSDLDAYSSNSGSSIFDANTHEIIGVLVRGSSLNFELQPGSCFQWGVAKKDHTEEGMILWNLP